MSSCAPSCVAHVQLMTAHDRFRSATHVLIYLMVARVSRSTLPAWRYIQVQARTARTARTAGTARTTARTACTGVQRRTCSFLIFAPAFRRTSYRYRYRYMRQRPTRYRARARFARKVFAHSGGLMYNGGARPGGVTAMVVYSCPSAR